MESPSNSNQKESKEGVVDYKYGQIDPRPIPEAKEANELLFSNPNGVLGIEVTIPAYAERCNLGNIDPQHTDGNVDLTAIESVRDMADLPSPDSSIVTVRADLDAVGSMALLKYKANGGELNQEMLERIESIAQTDKFSRGGWPGKTALPTKENPWPEQREGVDLRFIGACISDFRLPLVERVEKALDFLVNGIDPEGYKERVEKEREDMIKALQDGLIKIELSEDGSIAYVESTHRAGLALGYTQAPVVVALNPEFKQGPGDAYKKYTIAQYDASWVDLVAVKDKLASVEEGWGGSPTIIGSPQGKSSDLSREFIESVVLENKKHG